MTDHTPARFGAALRRLLDHLDAALERAYRDDGLDFRPRYTPVVRALAERGPMSIRALAGELRLSHSAVSQTVTQMIAKKLLTAAAGDDARERIITLSDATRSLLPRLQRHWDAAERATQALDADCHGALVTAVECANRALEHHGFDDRLRGAAAKAGSRDTVLPR